MENLNVKNSKKEVISRCLYQYENQKNENEDNNKKWTLKEVRERCNHYNAKTGKGTAIEHNEIKKFIIEQNKIAYIDNVLHVYRNGCFSIDLNSKQTLQAIEKCIEDNLVTAQRKRAVLELLQQDETIERLKSDTNLYDDWVINFKDKMFNVRTLEGMKHDVKYYSTIQIPHEIGQISLDPDATCKKILEDRVNGDLHPNFSKLLKAQKLAYDDIEMLLQYIGLCMTRDKCFKAYIVVQGESDTGKSILGNVVQNIVGDANYSSVSMHDMYENKFKMARMQGMILNLSSDISGRPVLDTENLKKVSGNDKLELEEKHKDSLKVTLFTKLFFLCNHIPFIQNDTSNAIYNRLRILIMDIPIKEKDKDKQLEKKIDKELEEIIKTCIIALHFAYKNNDTITDSENSKKKKIELQEASDSIEAFINNVLEKKSTNHMRKSDCYKAYIETCLLNEQKPFSKKNFFSKMTEKGYIVATKDHGNDHYIGIAIDWEKATPEIFALFGKNEVVKRK